MSLIFKAPAVYKPTQSRLAAPPVYRPQVNQNSNLQAKPDSSFKLETRSAPAVYRPQQASSTQAKVSKPSAPSVYRPQRNTAILSAAQAKVSSQSVPFDQKIGQAKNANIQTNQFQLESRPAPAVYRPNQTQAGVQPKQAGVVQRACLFSWCGWGSSEKSTSKTGGELEQLVPQSPPSEDKTIFLGEGSHQIVEAGDKISNSGVTSCGLVLAFGSEGILAYHWPFMGTQYLEHFRGLLSKIGTVNKIEIYTNPIPSGSKSNYQLTLRNIRYNHTKNTRHYIYGTELTGDVTVTLSESGVESCKPSVTGELPPG